MKVPHSIHNSSFFIFGVIASVAIFEVYLQAVEVTPLWRILPVAEVSLYGPDYHTGYTLRPNVEGVWTTENRTKVRISPQGTRDSDKSFSKPKGINRVIVAGDSFTEALQVELNKNFVTLMQQRSVISGENIEAVNLGISGASPVVQLKRVEQLGQHFEPDLIIFMINANDFFSPEITDDSAFPAYVKTGKNDYRIGYGFRESRGYTLRTGDFGTTIYWMMDRFRVMRVLNSWRNRDFLIQDNKIRQDLQVTCSSQVQQIQEAGKITTAETIIRRFAFDLHLLQKKSQVSVILFLRGLSNACGRSYGKFKELNDFFKEGIDSSNFDMQVVDMDFEVMKSLKN
jgi:hypothetical protein